MPNVVFVIGSGRSGSTMTHLMLANADNAFACGEVHAIYRPWRKHHFDVIYPCPVWEKITQAPVNRLHWTVAQETGAEWVVESSKDNVWILDSQKWVQDCGMRAINLLIWKDPIALAYSLWKRGNLNLWRDNFVGPLQKTFEMRLPLISVRYEDLAANPSAMLEKICKAIGMEYFPGKENFWEKKHCHLFGSAGIRQQVERGESKILQPAEGYPEEFEALIPQLEAQIAADSAMSQVMEHCKQYDINNHPLDGSAHEPFKPRPVYPAWYYAKRLQKAIKRYFPEDFERATQAETVPTVTGTDSDESS